MKIQKVKSNQKAFLMNNLATDKEVAIDWAVKEPHKNDVTAGEVTLARPAPTVQRLHLLPIRESTHH